MKKKQLKINISKTPRKPLKSTLDKKKHHNQKKHNKKNDIKLKRSKQITISRNFNEELTLNNLDVNNLNLNLVDFTPETKLLFDLFNYDNIPKNSKLLPRIQNYSSYVRLINVPNQEWLIYNVPGSLENTKKKKSITFTILGKKLIFKATSLSIYGECEINRVLYFMSTISENDPRTLIKKKKRKKGIKTQNVIFLNLNDLKINDEKIETVKFFNFIDQLFEKRKKNSAKTPQNKPINVPNIKKETSTPWYNKCPLLPEYWVEDIDSSISKNTHLKKILILEFNTLHVVGEKSIEKIKKYLKVCCNIINIRKMEEFQKSNKLLNENVYPLKMECGKKLTTTNIVYQIQIPRKFTSNLLSIYKNLPSDLKIRYTRSCEPNKFPALIIKLFELDGHKKTTLEIYRTGFISITGFKNDNKIRTVYPYVMLFITAILPVSKKKDFISMFRNVHVGDDKIFKDFTKIDHFKKLEEEFKKERDQLENIIKKGSSGGGKGIGLMFRKSDIDSPKEMFSVRYRRQYEIDFDNLKKPQSILTSYYNQSLNIFNFNTLNLNTLNNWFKCSNFYFR